ncbi:MAG: rhodanese-like domain-containing protein [Hyphomicrobiaceae bacterium]
MLKRPSPPRRAGHRLIAAGLLVTLFSILSVSVSAHGAGLDDPALDAVHRQTAARHARVQHIMAGDLAKLQQQTGGNLLILDVREKEEHAVSRLPGATRVAPSISATEFMRAFADRLGDRVVVLYCSVGVRSTQLADRIQRAARAAGARAVYNLAGGAFHWHNQSRPMVDSAGPTRLVHPFSWRWSKLVRHRDRISYTPAPKR